MSGYEMTKHSAALFAALLPIAGVLSGCGALVGPATRASVEEGLSTLATPQSGEDVGRMLSDPAIQEAAAALVRVLVSAAAEELTNEERLAQIEDAIEHYAARLSGVVGEQIRLQSAGVMAELDALVREVEDEPRTEAQNTIGEYVAALTRVMVSAAARQMEEDAPSAMARMASEPELQAALRESGRALGQGIVVGMDEGLEARARHVEEGGHSFLITRLETVGETGESVTGQLSWVTYAGSAAVALIVALLVWQLRRMRRLGRRREAVLSTLTRAIQETSGRPWSPELIAALREHFRDAEPGSDYLRDLLREQRAADTPPIGGPHHPSPA
jgi:hypothetical protein